MPCSSTNGSPDPVLSYDTSTVRRPTGEPTANEIVSAMLLLGTSLPGRGGAGRGGTGRKE
ncbi:hypothetical protein [Streptomyces sp. NPDC088746]|uniref:hypothetical protein n=1 Tax=Streptomyces sp. NPDC088746 TaxID=3365885 RepID=UPI0038000F1A